MANVHGLNDVNRNQAGRRAPPQGMGMPMGPGADDPLIGDELRNNRVPFMNTFEGDRPPLDETIPYTLKIVWCPTIKLFSLAVIFSVAIWVMYIFCLTQGIANDIEYGVLPPTVTTLRKYGAISYQLVKDGEIWRLITAGFLHINLPHIVMNTVSLLFLLTRLEAIYNPLIIGCFMLVSMVSGIYPLT